MKDKKRIIIGSIAVILLVVIIITFCIKTELYIREEKINNEEIEHIALVYRDNNFASGAMDYIYIIDNDGSVYYEDLIDNSTDYNEYNTNILSMILNVYENDSKVKYKFEEFSDSFIDQLYTTNYNWSLFTKGGVEFDGGEQTYYALIKIENYYELIKLRQSGNLGKTSWNDNYNDICKYIDTIRMQIYNIDINENNE